MGTFAVAAATGAANTADTAVSVADSATSVAVETAGAAAHAGFGFFGVSTLIEKFQEGGVFMIFILVLGVFTVAFIFERYRALYRDLKEPSETLRKQLLPLLAQGDAAGASRVAAGLPQDALARIARIGLELRADGAGEEEIQARMDGALTHEVHSTDRRTGFLAMFGNVATLLGLLGTISGMISSFAAVASANPADRATLLSKGISEAMNCTAFGLIVAIPALVAYAIFQNRTDRYVSQLTAQVTEIFNDILFLVERGSQAAGKAMARSASASQTISSTTN
jgi:biopolymer transport protein ExbB/TolQ